ncbi:hypothetical protein AB0C93_16365 [Streptomyces sp. NPDC048518]|uniref:hypothetical protein n=1 Tax=Streptomyces sp. NPDC048518 TaxID=3155029 RepID=UPI0033C1D970
MEAGDYIAAGSAIVAATAACIGWQQGRTARRAALAAEAQAHAALAQVELVREQLTQARAARDEADRPVFAVTETDVHYGNGTPEILLVLTQTGGSPLAEARLTVHLNDEPALVVGAGDDGVLTWRHTAPGATKTLRTRPAARHRGTLEIRVDLTCREADGERQWTCRALGYVHGDWRRNAEARGLAARGEARRRPGRVPDQPSEYVPEYPPEQPGPEDEGLPHYPWIPHIDSPFIVHPDETGLLAVTPLPVRTRPAEDPDPTATDSRGSHHLSGIW